MVAQDAIGAIKTYGPPIVSGITGILGEDYARSQGTSLAIYLKEGTRQIANTIAPQIDKGSDEIGKGILNFINTSPELFLLGLVATGGLLYVAGRKGYIRSPIGRPGP